jgi:DNA-binding transcriptional ArsR family regulator
MADGSVGLDLYIARWQYCLMVIHSRDAALNVAFAALADPTRRAILARLAAGDADVSELMKPFSLSQPTISKHLKVLERAGLITLRRDAQRRPRTLVAQPLQSIDEWLESYRRLWDDKFASLDGYLNKLQTNEKRRRQPRRR